MILQIQVSHAIQPNDNNSPTVGLNTWHLTDETLFVVDDGIETMRYQSTTKIGICLCWQVTCCAGGKDHVTKSTRKLPKLVDVSFEGGGLFSCTKSIFGPHYPLKIVMNNYKWGKQTGHHWGIKVDPLAPQQTSQRNPSGRQERSCYTVLHRTNRNATTYHLFFRREAAQTR